MPAVSRPPRLWPGAAAWYTFAVVTGLQYLCFDLSDNTDGVATLEALASTPPDAPQRHAAVLAEVQQVLDWAAAQFPHSQGPVEEGMDWDHDLQVRHEPDGWQAVTLTLTGSQRFVEAWMQAFADQPET